MSTRARSVSSRYCEPVTVRVAPRKVRRISAIMAAMAPLPRPEPFDPLRKGLYTADELMQGYASSNPDGALDRRIARYFVGAGGRNPPSAAEAIAQRGPPTPGVIAPPPRCLVRPGAAARR